jgi:hypothetical protein
MERTQAEVRPLRPLGVVVIALFFVIDAAFAIVQIVADTPFATRTATLVEMGDWVPAFIVGLALAEIVAAFGLWRGYRWAWVLAMLAVGIGLLAALAMYVRGDPYYPRLVLNMIMAFYLNQGAVRRSFEARTGATGGTPRP